MSPVGLRDLLRAEETARRAGRESAALDDRARAAGSTEEREVIKAGALDLRLVMVRNRLVFFFGASRSTYEFATRLESWVREQNIGPAQLDALAEALTWKDTPYGRS